MQLSIELVNKILKDIENPNPKILTFIERKNVLEVDTSDPRQGVEGEYFIVFKINDIENLFLKAEYRTDSYGYNDRVVGFQFVKGVAKTVTVYEVI